jgi:hypothetical protein
MVFTWGVGDGVGLGGGGVGFSETMVTDTGVCPGHVMVTTHLVPGTIASGTDFTIVASIESVPVCTPSRA